MGPGIAPSREDVVARLRRAGCVYAEAEADVLLAAAAEGGDLEAMITRRAGGEPLELVVGWAEFCGSRVAVAPGVFIPRRRTELLVEVAVAAAPAGAVVVDLCCGTGAIALAVARRVAAREVHAADISVTAVACARRNLSAVGGHVHAGDLYDALPHRLLDSVDLLLVNAPYVPTPELHLMPAEARDHEPPSTLDGGVDGVELHRRVAAGAARWLSRRGRLVVETSERQAPLTVAAVGAAGLEVEVVRDADRDATVVVGRQPP